MINKKKTITIFAVLLTVLLIPSGIITYAESDDTQTSKTQNLKQAFDDMETSMIQNPMITSGLRSPVGPSPASSVNMVMINEDAGELWIGIDRSKYSGSLDSFESHLQNKYPNTPIRVEHADFEWNACPSLTSNTCNPQVAGMEYWYLVSSKDKKDATLGLAVEDNNGKKGVVISAHAVGFGNIGKNIASDILRDKGNFVYPVHHGKVIKNTAPDLSNVVPCDCAFVEFTKTNGIYNETVEKNKIYKSRNAVYTVTGVHAPVHGDAIKMVGQRTGSNSTNIIGTSFTASDGIKVKGTFATNSIMKKGDSGAPIFTTPNRNNEVKIVGMHSGTFDFAGTDVDVHMPWSKIATDLGLKAP